MNTAQRTLSEHDISFHNSITCLWMYKLQSELPNSYITIPFKPIKYSLASKFEEFFFSPWPNQQSKAGLPAKNQTKNSPNIFNG